MQLPRSEIGRARRLLTRARCSLTWARWLAFPLCLVACGSETAAPEQAPAFEQAAGSEQAVEAPDVADTPTAPTSSAMDGPTIESVTTAAPVAAPTTTTVAGTTAAPPSTATVAPTTVPPPSATLPPAAEASQFSGSFEEISDATKSRLTHSWREGCPVSLDDLRLVTVSHWNYLGETKTGELIVHADFAAGIVDVFRTLYDARFPIERMELVDTYSGDDDLSMAANNTSAFNCREVAWKPGVWSNHAFGTAIDVNPLVNPYVSTSRVLPPEGAQFADRSVEALGGLYPGDVATAAFADIGLIWGGTWPSAKDWQHFSASGG